MGIPGLTTFISNRSWEYMEDYELRDTKVVIDGDSISCQLYVRNARYNDCFGGDYDKYAQVVGSFFQLLADCNVTPLVVFDGAYEVRKLKTIYSRMKKKIETADRLNSVSEGRACVFPLFLREAFLDVAFRTGARCVRCDFEGDSDAAHLARNLQCPILSYDSDFYIYDVLYVPFSTVDLRVRRHRGNYIGCKIYRVEKFVQSFGLDKSILPLLAVLLGNDYIKRQTFSRFYRQLKMYRSRENEQQTQIKSLMFWLRGETPESALRKILGRYKLPFRRRLVRKIERAIEVYQCGSSVACSYFNVREQQSRKITMPNPEEIELIDEGDDMDDEISDDEPEPQKNIPKFFQDKFRQCMYPSCFMNILISNTYYCIPQVEESSEESSHLPCFRILAAISKIFMKTRPLICIGRQDIHIKKYFIPVYPNKVPTLFEIEQMHAKDLRSTFFDILNLGENALELDAFPPSWHLFLISVKYWTICCSPNLSHLYSLLLCVVVLNLIDPQIGFYRCARSFFAKYARSGNEYVAAMKKLIHLFEMEPKMRSHSKLYDKAIVHKFAQFQSCLLHIKYLNSLLNLPFSEVIVSDFYDGTFVYNMAVNLQKRTDINAYMRILLDDCPSVLDNLNTVVNAVRADLQQGDVKKRRRKRHKKATDVQVEDMVQNVSDDEEYQLDSNNKFSLLSFVNK